MSVINGFRCDNCRYITTNANLPAGWIYVSVSENDRSYSRKDVWHFCCEACLIDRFLRIDNPTQPRATPATGATDAPPGPPVE